MTLDDAIKEFEKYHKPFTVADKATIRSVVDEIGATEFDMPAHRTFFRTADDAIHVHPTMIVAATQITNSYYAGTYEKYPYRLDLSNSNERSVSGSVDAAVPAKCQECFNPLDAHVDGACF